MARITPPAVSGAIATVGGPSGVAATDTAAIQAALTAVPATGGEVRLLKGTYLVNAKLVIKPYTRLVGAGPGTVLKLADSANVHIIENAAIGDTDISIENLTVDGNKANQNADHAKRGLSMLRVHNLTLFNVWAYRVDGTGIFISGEGDWSHGTQLTNVRAIDNYDGIQVAYSTRDSQYTAVFAKDNDHDGVFIDSSETTCAQVTAVANGRYGIWIRNLYSSNLHGLSASRNQSYGIYVLGLCYSIGSDWRAQSNYRNGGAGGGAEVYFSGDNSMSYGVTKHCRVSNILAGGTTVAMDRQTFTNYGVYVEDGVVDNVVLDPVVYGEDGGGTVADYRLPTRAATDSLFYADFPIGLNVKRLVRGQTSDPASWGIPRTTEPEALANTAATFTANLARYNRLKAGGVAISKVGMHVATASGNISVAAYRNLGEGRNALPTGGKLASSGSVACPAAGYAEVSLGSTVTPLAGDWFGVSCDNTTAVLRTTGGGVLSDLGKGVAYQQSSAHPLPDTPSSLTAVINLTMGLVGVP